ncbi:MAG: dephospho-CoA kinase [Acidobacteria bacterium]|nr:dephospho-CoA kinase [Acidobacteriota bacterium]
MSPAVLVGLTGGLASGKSTVARWLAELGCTVLDADRLVAELYRPGGEGARAVAELFGETFLDAEGAVDRPRVAERVFGDAEARGRLEAVVHPLVRRRFAELSGHAEGIWVYEATLLVEAGRADEFDLVVSVEADPELRLERAVARGLDEDSARARLAAQGDGELRRRRADLILDNDRGLEELRNDVEALHRDLLERLAVRGASLEGGALAGSVLVTGNRHKLDEARRLVGEGLESHALDLPEIQSLDLETVIAAKADAARAAGLGRAVVVEDVALELDAFSGFPGPLVKWMLEALGAVGIARAVHRLGPVDATARCLLCWDDGRRRVLAEGSVRGRITEGPRGDAGFGWDPIFVPERDERTYAEMPERRKDALGHRGLAWRALVAALSRG